MVASWNWTFSCSATVLQQLTPAKTTETDGNTEERATAKRARYSFINQIAESYETRLMNQMAGFVDDAQRAF